MTPRAEEIRTPRLAAVRPRATENAMSPKVAPPPPSSDELSELLGRSQRAWETFLARHADLRPEWKYYGPKVGWSLKLFDRGRNLCFLGPHEGSFTIAFILGGPAASAALEAPLPDGLKQEIRASRVYVEGRVARIPVKYIKDLAPADLLLEIKRAH